jgi:short-subunit dehydrogenase
MIELNVTALTELTKLFLPPMIAAGRGRILNVASTAAFQPGPLMAVYYATKAYVLSFSEALANELEGSGVTVTAFCPGPTATGFVARAKLQSSKHFAGAIMDVREVAERGHRGFLAGRPLVFASRKHAFYVFLWRFLPRQAIVRIIRGIQERRGGAHAAPPS